MVPFCAVRRRRFGLVFLGVLLRSLLLSFAIHGIRKVRRGLSLAGAEHRQRAQRRAKEHE
jgi:hypothetical protein